MTSLHPAATGEPRAGAELIARYRAARERLYSPATRAVVPKKRTPIRDLLVRTNPATVRATMPATIPGPVSETSATPSHLISSVELSKEKFGPILKMVSGRTGVSVDDILGKSRRAPIVAARQEAMWAVKAIANWSLPRIGGRFNRDHTTVLHAIHRVEERATEDAELRAFVEAIKNAFC